MHKYTRFIGAFILIGLAVTAVLRAEIIEQILVKVNGEIFTKSDLEQRQSAVLRQRNEQFDARSMSDAELAKQLAEITPQVVVDAVDELLLLQRARELGYTMSEDQFRSVLDNIKKENKIETEEQFQAALKQEGMAIADLRKALERNMLISRVQQAEVSAKIDVTEDEEKRFYESHPADFASTPSVTLREILVAVPSDGKTVNVAREEEAKAKAEALRARALAGENFEKLASAESDAPSKANGGLIGPLSREELTPELQKVLEGLKTGDVSPILRVPSGYELLKVESSITSTRLPFEEARQEIASRLFEEKRRVEMEKYLKKLRTQAIIEWKNDEIRKAFEQGLAAQPSQ